MVALSQSQNENGNLTISTSTTRFVLHRF